MTDDDPSKVEAAHDLATTLRNEGYTVGFDSSDVVEEFDEHVDAAQQQLDAEDLGAFFVVAHRDGQTDYSSSVVLDHDVAWGVIQIEMLGAHFRSVLDALPLDTTALVEAMVDEALTIDEHDADPDGEPRTDGRGRSARGDTYHRRFGAGWYCADHGATFETQEMERNDGNCPWCGRPVDTDTERQEVGDRDA